MLEEALKHADTYLATGQNAHWDGFRPLFAPRPEKLPHRDWVANVYKPRRCAALRHCENALETLNRKAKERRRSDLRKGAA